MKIEKTGYNYRTRKERDIMAFIYDANGVLIDAINPGTGNHRTALDWATWRANTIREDYPEANTMAIHCGDDEIAIITLDNNTTPTTSDTMNTETKAMNEEKVTAIYNRVDSMKVRGAWNNGVKAYALMLLEWYKDEASENPLTLETMLNGAKGWGHYSRSGCGVAQCYNARIAETLCSPSELKRVKGGLKNPNRFEDWCDVEGRALFQAWQFIKRAENFVNCNA